MELDRNVWRTHLLHFRVGALATDPPEEGRLPLLVVLPLRLLLLAIQALLGQLALHEIALPPTALDAGVLQRCGAQGDMFSTAQEQL